MDNEPTSGTNDDTIPDTTARIENMIDRINGNGTEQETASNPNVTTSTNFSLEDSICAICMDYCIDTQETNCKHKFCKFCVDRWISYNPFANCPTCRRCMGQLKSMPQLDVLISASLQNTLAGEELTQRQAVIDHRQTAGLLTRGHPIWESSRHMSQLNILSPIVSNRFHQLLPFEEDFRRQQILQVLQNPNNSISNGSSNPWSTQSTASIINRLRDSIERIQNAHNELTENERQEMDGVQRSPNSRTRTEIFENTLTEAPQSSRRRFTTQANAMQRIGWIPTLTEQRNISSNNSNRPSMDEIDEILSRQRISTPLGLSSYPVSSQNRRIFLRSVIEDDLLANYDYHLRRIDAAHARVLEAQHDFDHHHTELEQIYQEFISIQELSSHPPNIIPEAYEDIHNVSSYTERFQNILDSSQRLFQNPNESHTRPTERIPTHTIDARMRTERIVGDIDATLNNLVQRLRVISSITVSPSSERLPEVRRTNTNALDQTTVEPVGAVNSVVGTSPEQEMTTGVNNASITTPNRAESATEESTTTHHNTQYGAIGVSGAQSIEVERVQVSDESNVRQIRQIMIPLRSSLVQTPKHPSRFLRTATSPRKRTPLTRVEHDQINERDTLVRRRTRRRRTLNGPSRPITNLNSSEVMPPEVAGASILAQRNTIASATPRNRRLILAREPESFIGTLRDNNNER